MFVNEPHQDPEDAIKEMNDKDTIHEHNKKEEHEAHDHENKNPHLGRGHNPIHDDIGRK